MSGIKNAVKNGLSGIAGLFQTVKNCILIYFKYGILGNSIRMEVSTLCQLQCPLCYRTYPKKIEVIGLGNLKFSDFKRFVDTYPEFKNIEITSKGEIFLNPELKDILRYAYEKKISITALIGVNLNSITEEMIDLLVRYKVKGMTVSIDGASSKTYQLYRKGGDFDTVIANVKKINLRKRELSSKYPILYWQFIIFGHNEHELPTARSLAASLGMKFEAIFNYKEEYLSVVDKELVRKHLGAATSEEFEKKTGMIYQPLCFQYWISPQINWDGRLLGCCCNMYGDFGNVFKDGLAQCIKSERYTYARKMLLFKKKPRPDMPCLQCDMYPKIRKVSIFRMLISILRISWKRISVSLS